MTTTAHEDQFTVGTQTIERIREPYNTVSILKQNVAALEVALRTQTERAEAAEAELARLREQKQKPMGWIDADGDFYHGRHYPNVWPTAIPVYVEPTPAPAVPYGVDEEAANRIALAVYDCKNDICPEPLLYAINRILATEAHPLSVEGRDALLPSAPQAPAVPEQKPIWSGWSVWFKGGDGLFPAHFLHDSYGIPLRYPTRFDAAEKIKRHTRDSRELYEPREYSLYDAPQAPAVPSGCVAYLAQLADDPCQCHCCRTKRRKASALLQSAEVTK